jgi:hypothetical protein
MQGAMALLGAFAIVFLTMNVTADFHPERAFTFQPEVAFSGCVGFPPDVAACRQMAHDVCQIVLSPVGVIDKLDDYCG